MALSINPFPQDADRHAIWDMLVARDIRAFVKADWNLVTEDFVSANFIGIQANKSTNADHWKVGFPNLETYKQEWLRQAKDSAAIEYAEDLEVAIHAATRLEQIDFDGDTAMAHKKFDGKIKRKSGEPDILNWQTLYLCRKELGQWKIAGFVGYMAYRGG